MPTRTHLNDQILEAVGSSTPPRQGLVTAHAIAKFCAAIDDPNPLYTDPAAARAAGYADLVSPPLFNATVTRPVPPRSGLLADGQYETTAPPGLTHLQTMLAGQSWEMLRRSVAGEKVIEQFTTRSITERQGATGPVVFVEREATITSVQSGEVIERYGSTLILRDPPPPLPPFASEALPPAAQESGPPTSFTPDGMIKRPDMITLFMFAATIWAVHRIHWDVPFARAEGLPAPLLPGWMLASYFAQLAETRAREDQHLRTLAIRYRVPAHPGDTLECRATADPSGEGLSLDMINQHGKAIATGTALFALRDLSSPALPLN